MSAPILTIKDVADYLKVNERTIYRLAASGELPGFKVGNSWRFKQSELEQYITAQHNRTCVSEALKSSSNKPEDN
jgi:excisionase family DNA binding protein